MSTHPRARGLYDQGRHPTSPLGATLRALALLVASALFVCCVSKPPTGGSATPTDVDLAAPTGGGTPDDPESAPTPVVQATCEQLPVGPRDAVSGASDALVTVVQFQDFQCPFCGRVQATLEQLRREYRPDELRFVFKHNPLPFHQEAMPAAQAAQAVFAVGGSEAFFAYSRRLFKGQRDLNEHNFEQWAQAVGVSTAAFWNAWEDPAGLAKIQEDMALAQAVGARGTPAFRVNGVEISGAQPYEKFKAVIDAELRAASNLVDERVPRMEIYAQRVAVNLGRAPAEEDPPAAPAEDTTIWDVQVGKAPTRGPADALVTIVEFGDYECPFCGRVQATLDELEKRYPGELRFVFKHNALPFHSRAMPAAMLAIEAQKQKGTAAFWDVHRRLFEAQRHLEDADLIAIATAAGLNVASAQRAITNETHKPLVEQDQGQAQDLEARGTPHFFINGYRVAGAQPLEKFVAVVEERRAAAEELVKQGTPRSGVYAAIMKTAKGPPPLETKQVPAPTAASPSRGPAGAPIVVQMFSDYQCPFCLRVEPTVTALEQEFPGQIRVVWRDLPLPFHQHAKLAAEAAREAFAQRGSKGYWAMHDLLFQHQQDQGGLERPALEQYAAQIGLDVARFNAALDAHTHEATVEADAKLANQAGINGTPGFVINGYYVSGAQPLTQFRKVVKQALADRRAGKKP